MVASSIFHFLRPVHVLRNGGVSHTLPFVIVCHPLHVVDVVVIVDIVVIEHHCHNHPPMV